MQVDEAMANYSKEQLAALCRAAGWQGDDARTPKQTLAQWFADHGVNGTTTAPEQTTPEQTTTTEQTTTEQTSEQPRAIRIKARFPSKCARCSGAIQKGERIQYVKAKHAVYHMACWTTHETNSGDQAEEQVATDSAEQAPTTDKRDAHNVVASAIAQALSGLSLGANPAEIRAAVKAEMTTVADELRAEIKQQVYRVEIKFPDGKTQDVGRQHRQFPLLVKALAAGCHVWLAGPAGSFKTTSAEAAARALNLPFSFDGAMDTEYKVLGFVDAQGRIVSTQFRKAYTEGGCHLFDECDASLAPATLAINAALANGYAAFPDGMVQKHPNFRCIAAANTWGLGATFDYVGRNKLDAAFLDRFVRLNWEYDETMERDICTNPDWCSFVQTLRVRAKAKGLKVVISPRASFFGAQLLAAGIARDDVVALTMRNGMRPEDWKALQS